MSFIVPAVLAKSKEELERTLDRFASLSAVSRVQIDVVDGHFATPASWPYTDAEAFKTNFGTELLPLPAHNRIEYEVDLMCVDAERSAGKWLDLGASRLAFHLEALLDIEKFFASVTQRFGRDAVTYGIAVNVESDLARIEPILEYISFVQCMGIATIGRQGQPFDTRVIKKLSDFHKKYPHIPLQVDGGVSLGTARALLEAGATSLVVGSALTRARDLQNAFNAFELLQSSFAV